MGLDTLVRIVGTKCVRNEARAEHFRLTLTVPWSLPHYLPSKMFMYVYTTVWLSLLLINAINQLMRMQVNRDKSVIGKCTFNRVSENHA